jgi:hypothetical protein
LTLADESYRPAVLAMVKRLRLEYSNGMLDKRYAVKVEVQTVVANGWVESGNYWTAMFEGKQPDEIRGCPCGRSQESGNAAIVDLLQRTNGESGTAIKLSQLDITRKDYTKGGLL